MPAADVTWWREGVQIENKDEFHIGEDNYDNYDNEDNYSGEICPSRQSRRECKIFASGVNFSIFTHFLCFFLLTVEIR